MNSTGAIGNMGDQQLNDCGCCEGLSVQTPVDLTNPPGLSAIAYRVGTYNQFKRSMLASLSISQLKYLAALKTRSDDDFSIAVLDAWAVVADILTFYQERIANESFLRTATERRSILELAQLIGYELRPALAADVYLSFTIESAPGAPHQTAIDAGTRVQSVPGPGEKAQTFETSAPIEARADWNAMKPRLTTRHPFKDANKKLLQRFYFAGVATSLRLGDALIIVPDDDNTPVFCQVTGVTPQPEQQRTQVDILAIPNSLPIPHFTGLSTYLNPASTVHLSQATGDLFSQPVRAGNLAISSAITGIATSAIFANYIVAQRPPAGVLTFRTRAAIFGHNAPRLESLPYSLTHEELAYNEGTPPTPKLVPGPYHERNATSTWVEGTLNNYHIDADPQSQNVYLDMTYPGIAPNSYVVLWNGKHGTWALHQVSSTADQSVADFTLTGKITCLTLDNNDDFEYFGIRTTTVYGQSEQLILARLPIPDPVAGAIIDADGLIDGLFVGQGLMVCGELNANRGNNACEFATIQNIEYHNEDEGFTRITLAGNGLQNAYVRSTVSICGNVAPATHGETRQEVLGSGDGGQPYQKFTLRQSPLTYTSSAELDEKFSGEHSTLQVYVNDVLWHEVPALYGHGPTKHVYTTQISDDGKTTIQFGDGLINGARLPTGQENVRAVYRTGSGLDGMVKAGQLSLLLTRPAGVRGVINAQDATDAADPEKLEDARQNAPLPVMTLGRIVSLRDYEDFARAFAGVAKALATWTWNGQQRGIFVTVAGPRGDAIDAASQLFANLLRDMLQAGDPYVPLRVQSYVKRFFRISALVKINPDYLADTITKALETTLRAHFSFEVRAFGQMVALSEVTGAMQSVEGVVAVNVTALYRSYPIGQDPAVRNMFLTASLPFAGEQGGLQAAELLTLDPGALDITITK